MNSVWAHFLNEKKSFCWFYPFRGKKLDCAKPLEAWEMFQNNPEPQGGHFKSRTPENLPPHVSCTKKVNLMSSTPQVILVYGCGSGLASNYRFQGVPDPYLGSEVFKYCVSQFSILICLRNSWTFLNSLAPWALLLHAKKVPHGFLCLRYPTALFCYFHLVHFYPMI